ncbi:MAG: archaeosine synthase subunit alpha [Methanosarcinaceae archaeon]|nr:archaeosine synthase subunit alpha [Methanosarcinaceae archaeon]
MTRYFEVQQRDGAARIGKLLLDMPIRTPHLIEISQLKKWKEGNNPILDAGSLWSLGSKENAQRHLEDMRAEVGDDTLIILPHQSFPLATPDDVAVKSADALDLSTTGAIGTAFRAGQKIRKSDLYVMEGAGSLENNSRRFFNTLLELKNSVPADTAVYAPNICMPENAAMLVYLGIDVVDDTRAVVAAYNDIYLTPSGRFYLDALAELPCKCETCAHLDVKELNEMDKIERAQHLEKHNRNVLEAELALVREKIRAGTLRDYIEGQCRTRPWLTALLRIADYEYDYIEQQTPIVRSNEMMANSGESQTRAEVVRFANRINERYSPPAADILLLLPCSAKKPYGFSNSHQKFIKALGKGRKFVHEVIITSPLGIVPRELELTYPAAHYDTAVTGYWDAEEKAWVGECLANYLSKHSYSTIVAHVEGAYRDICESVSKELRIEFIYTSNGNVTSHESLRNLKDTVSELCEGRKRSAETVIKDMLRKIADYQFGHGAGDILIPERAAIKAPFPKHQVYVDKTHVATLVPQYGTLAITIAGAEMLLPHNKYVIKIEDFVPKGSILAVGVTSADPNIRPNDEVLVSGSKAFCVGRAVMSGKEMEGSTRGIAVDLRHVKKLK